MVHKNTLADFWPTVKSTCSPI